VNPTMGVKSGFVLDKGNASTRDRVGFEKYKPIRMSIRSDAVPLRLHPRLETLQYRHQFVSTFPGKGTQRRDPYAEDL